MSRIFGGIDRRLALNLYVLCPYTPMAHIAALMRALAQSGWLDDRWATMSGSTLARWRDEDGWDRYLPDDAPRRSIKAALDDQIPSDAPEPEIVPGIQGRSFADLDDELLSIERSAYMRAFGEYARYLRKVGSDWTEEHQKIAQALHRQMDLSLKTYQGHLNQLRAARIFRDTRLATIIIEAIKHASAGSKENFQAQVLSYIQRQLGEIDRETPPPLEAAATSP